MPKILALSGSGGAGVANSTPPSLPYLSATNTLSDSPLFRADANTIEERNGTTAQTLKVYQSYTDASNNHGIQISGSTIQPFANGSDAAATFFNLNNTGAGAVLINIGGAATLQVQANLIKAQGTANFQTKKGNNFSVNFYTNGQTTNFLNGITATPRTDNIITLGASVGEGNAGTYRMSWLYQCATAQGGASLSASLTWVDRNSTTRTRTLTLDLSAAANYVSDVVNMQCLASQTISVTATITGGGTAAYDARFAVEQLESVQG